MKNPYAWNEIHPDLCYGRDALLAELLSGLPGSPRVSFGIAGGRRMGKTTLLRRVEKELRAGIEQWRAGGLFVIPIYIDGLALPWSLSEELIWSRILENLHSATLDRLAPLGEPLTFDNFKETVQPILSEASDRPRVIVLFDEIEPIDVREWSDSFFDHWRALLSNTPGLSEYFTAVFAGAREMTNLQRDITSPLADVLEWRPLHLLDYEDSVRLMQEPSGIEWETAFMQRVWSETGGHPMLIQYIMQQTCSLTTPEIAAQSLSMATQKFSREHKRQFAQWWEKYCTPTAQRIYQRLPDDGSPLSLSTLVREFGLNDANDALEILQHVGLSVAEADETRYRYAGEMFRRWFRIYGTMTEAPLHDTELSARLGNISPNLAAKYLSAWKIYQSDLPNYSGVLVELRGVLESLLDRYAPNSVVQNEPNFKFETDRKEPTLRQRLRHMARQQYDAERAKEIVSDYNLFEINSEALSRLATMAHRTASGMAHDTATREMAFRALKQWDSILAQLIPNNSN